MFVKKDVQIRKRLSDKKNEKISKPSGLCEELYTCRKKQANKQNKRSKRKVNKQLAFVAFAKGKEGGGFAGANREKANK